MEFDEEQLARCLSDACQNSAALSDLLQAGRPDETWADRAALDQLIEQLEMAATERRIEQRRARILALAEELDAGRAKHRVEARSASLNKLRLDAVNELRHEATVEPAKELPGPRAGEWIDWACSLHDDKDAEILELLRRDFAALERFTSEMDPSYWVPGRGQQDSTVPSQIPATAPAESASSIAAPAVVASPSNGVEKLPEAIKAKFEKARESESYEDALALCYELPEEAKAEPQPAWGAQPEPARHGAALDSERPFGEGKTETETLKRCDQCGKFFPGELYLCPFDNAFLRTIADGDVVAVHPTKSDGNGSGKKANFLSGIGATTASGNGGAVAELPQSGDTSKDPAEVEFERLKNLIEQLPPPAPEEIEAAEIEEQKIPIPRQKIYEWVGAGSLVLLVIVVLIYYFYGTSRAEPSRTVAAANSVAAVAAPTPPDTTTGNPNSVVSKAPVEGPQDNIQLSLEQCERSKLGSIDCWGYVSNLGNLVTNIVVDRVDVVDGKGNSYSLYGTSQTSFPSGHRFNVPNGAHAKFALKLPDKDKQARSVTLYVDLNSPRNLEYTFRDIPVKE